MKGGRFSKTFGTLAPWQRYGLLCRLERWERSLMRTLAFVRELMADLTEGVIYNRASLENYCQQTDDARKEAGLVGSEIATFDELPPDLEFAEDIFEKP